MLDSKHYVFYTQRLLMGLYKFLQRISKEYTTGIMLPQHSALTFLDRMVKASHIRPLKRLKNGHLSEIKECYKQQALNKNASNNTEPKTFAKRVREEGLFKALLPDDAQISEREAEDIAAERLEEERVIANVIGLAVVISVHFSKGDKIFNEYPPL
jgi:hypothetical protein